MAVQIQDETLENFEYNFISFDSVLSTDNTDLDKNFFNEKLQQIVSPYFSVENFVTISEQLTILTWKNFTQYKNSLKYKVDCFWGFSYVYTIN